MAKKSRLDTVITLNISKLCVLTVLLNRADIALTINKDDAVTI